MLIFLVALVSGHDDEVDEYCEDLITECKQNYTSRCAHRKFALDSCCDLQIFEAPSGIYKIKVVEFDLRHVYCDMDTDDGGWIIIQRNKQGSSVSFNRKWDEYETGFGDLQGEFWYGLRGLSCLTEYGNWEMRLDFQKTDTTQSYLHYTKFKVGSVHQNYPLTLTGFTLKSGDLMSSANGRKFSAPDADNNNVYYYNCFSDSQWMVVLQQLH